MNNNNEDDINKKESVMDPDITGESIKDNVTPVIDSVSNSISQTPSTNRSDPYQLSKPVSARNEIIFGLIFLVLLVVAIFYGSSKVLNVDLDFNKLGDSFNSSDSSDNVYNEEAHSIEEVSPEYAMSKLGITLDIPEGWKAELSDKDDLTTGAIFISPTVSEYGFISVSPYEHSIPVKENFLEVAKDFTKYLYEDSKHEVILDEPVNINGLDGHYVIHRSKYDADSEYEGWTYSYTLYLYKDQVNGYRVFASYDSYDGGESNIPDLDKVVRSFKVVN